MPPVAALSYALAPFLSPRAGLVVAALFAVLLVHLLMRPKRFYMVRHGETLANAAHLKQGATGGLSEKGKAQAAKVGGALKGLGITRILSSDFERARQTALIVNESLHARIRYSPLLAERRNPSSIIGKSTHDPAVERIIEQLDLSYHDDDFRLADEENFLDQKARAKKCLRYLARHGARANCVVTHHAFLKMLIAVALYRDRLHAGDFVKLSFFNWSDNAGISILEYAPWHRFSSTRGWRVVSFNELVPE